MTTKTTSRVIIGLLWGLVGLLLVTFGIGYATAIASFNLDNLDIL